MGNAGAVTPVRAHTHTTTPPRWEGGEGLSPGNSTPRGPGSPVMDASLSSASPGTLGNGNQLP